MIKPISQKLKIPYLNSVEWLYCLYFLLKPFYMKSSGTLQVADVCIIIAGTLYVIEHLKAGVFDFKVMHPYYLLVFGIVIINTVYLIRLKSSQFIRSNMYWIYNLIFLMLSYALLENKELLKHLIIILKITIFLQLIIYIFGVGRWYSIGRYQGTFNDPNQFAFYLLMCGFCICIYCMYQHVFSIGDILCEIGVVFLVIKSASRGMTLCIILAIAFEILYGVYRIYCLKRIYYKVALFLLIVAVILIVLLVINILNFKLFEKEFSVWDRWAITISSIKDGRGLTSNGINAFQERGIDKVWVYPEYCIWGAGEGLYDRFDVYCKGEIHSTFLSILFCYGIIPFSLLFIWCVRNIKNLEGQYLALYFSLIIESFTLIHYRQPIFWLFFVMGYFISGRALGTKNNNLEELNRDEK